MKKALVLLATGAIALFVGAPPGIASAENPTTAGTVTSVTGKVTVARLGGAPQPLNLRDPLYWRDVVEAGRDSVARVLLGGKTTVTMRELSRLELRVEAQADGVRYTVDLVAGKVRASVARMLMRPGEQVEVRTRNAVASVRGTDFIVETVERPTHAGAFGLLGAREVAHGVTGSDSRTHETIVTTLSGVVDVSSPLAGTGRVERVRAYEAVRVSGRSEPVRLQIQAADVKESLRGLAQRPLALGSDRAESVGAERTSRAESTEPARTAPGELFLTLGLELGQLLLVIAAAAAAAYARRGQSGAPGHFRH